MSHRFFLDSEIVDNKTNLEGDQAHHALHVMRFKIGDELMLFDGDGTECRAVIVAASKNKLQLEVQSTLRSPPPERELAIACALPKGDRQKFLVEKLVELGVTRLIPLQTERSVAVANEKVLDRIRRHVIESSKQCGRNFLMQIESQRTVTGLVGAVTDPWIRWVASPYSETNLLRPTGNRSAVIAIGPEGGFTSEESGQFESAGWSSVRLGANVLRVETAAIAAAVLLGIREDA